MDKVYVIYGDDAGQMVKTVLDEMQVGQELAQLGIENPLIGIKPNLVVPQPAHWGATTAPELVRGAIEYLQQLGWGNIIILESSWTGASTAEAFEVCGYNDISKDLGVPLIDLKQEPVRDVVVEGMNLKVCGKALEVDYLINMPVLKAHCQTKLTCALKNLKGCIPDREKKRFHAAGLHKPIAALNKALHTDLVLVDGIIGDLTYEGGGTPVRMNRVIAGRDSVLVDTYAAELIGYQVEDVQYIGLARQLGLGSTEIDGKVVELNTSEQAPQDKTILASDEADRLARWIDAQQACSGCYGGLIHALKRLDEKGQLGKLAEKIAIGQGFKQKSGSGWGVGQCTAGFANNVMGCPPPAGAILRALEALAGDNR